MSVVNRRRTVEKTEKASVARKTRKSQDGGGNVTLHKKRLADFIYKTCKEKKLSLRSLSIKAGLSPGTVHSIIHRDYEPSLYSLNQLADFLGVKHQYMWYMAGLLDEDELEKDGLSADPRMQYYCEKVAKLPERTRELVLGIVADLVNYYATSNSNSGQEKAAIKN